MSAAIPTRIVPSVEPTDASPKQVARDFQKLIDGGAKIRPAGEAKDDPERLLCSGYLPKYEVSLFDTRFYLTNVRKNPAIRFLVAYVVQRPRASGPLEIFPRIFYKDLSLVWRAASHMIADDGDFWIGKGDVRTVRRGGFEHTECVESTTDLPFEVQGALDTINERTRRARIDHQALFLVLRNAPRTRIAPYSDFSEPRRKAARNPRNLIHGGRRIARFTRKNDPTSLQIVTGFEPDFTKGVLEVSQLKSVLYHGELQRFRILSRNRQVQYMFVAGPKHAWIIPPQALTTELSTYGVRTVDVVADEDLFVPGYEYHFVDETADGPVQFSQIPEGFAGPQSEHQDDRADASAWLDEIPLIRQFRRKVLGQG
ncbi:MAG: hypothetical protein AMJ62_01265 [Myxococcales bacterium SG8_38]|nr:MAG: hypothetical protein AMJ62_01265 [Myxococcales bacterium SG8_38]